MLLSSWRRKCVIWWSDQSGISAVLVALMFPLLLAAGALAVDLGNFMVVRNELHNAADGAALSGAARLFPSAPLDNNPNWSEAAASASTAIQVNRSSGVALQDCTVETGYWNLSRNPADLQPMGIVPGSLDVPAVRVTVERGPGHNGGPVRTFFASFFNVTGINASVRAVAVRCFPGRVEPGMLFPVAMDKALVDEYWGKDNITFKIGSSYHYPDSEAGQWTSFQVDSNNVPTIRDLIANGNPEPLGIGDSIWIQPGTKTTIYSSVPANTTVLLPVVDTIDTHAYVPIVGFAPFHIDFAVGGSDKYIQGHFVKDYKVSADPNGPNYGALVPPKLVF